MLRGIEIYFYERLPSGKVAIMTDMQFTEAEPMAAADIHPIVVSYETAQELIDSLWTCGLRPSEGTGSAGSLKAAENHLKDLQTLSFRLLDMIEKDKS
jgi:hypothetical protein